MRDWTLLFVVVGVGLVLVGAAGGVAAATPPSETSSAGAAAVGVDSGETDEVQIDEALREANGTVEVVVGLTDAEGATDVPALQAHADETQEPLAAFADERAGASVERQFWLTSAALVTVDTDRVALAELAAIEGVERLSENAAMSIDSGTPTGGPTAGGEVTASAGDAVGETTYGLEQINAPDVWEAYDTQGAGASVAVLDTGADPDHADIDVAKWAHFDGDGDEQDTDPHDGDGHGTHVSGTVTGGDASGTAIGVAPDADLYAVKVLDDDGSGTFSQILAGMEWAVEEDADVMSMSLGAEGYFEEFIDPVRNAQGAGTTVVASIGNDGEGTSSSPGNVYDAIAVGASDESENIASFSSGEEIDTMEAWSIHAPQDWPDEYVVPSVAAPGDDVFSAWPGGTYLELSGTSMAAPHVSGTIALVESALSEDISPEEYEDTLEETAWKPDDWDEPEGERDTRYGSGIIDAMAAVESLDEGPNLVLASIDHPDEIAPDEELVVEYTVENIGDEDGTESTVALAVEETDESEDDADEDVTVPAGETVDGTLAFDAVEEHFEHGDTISFAVELADFEDTEAGTTDVEGDPAEFLISAVDADDAVEGENLTVTADIENAGDREDTQEVALSVPDVGGDETEVTLAGGESTTTTLAVGTTEGDAGEHEATVSTANDTATANVTVLAAAEFVVDILETSDAVAGDDIEVTADIENVGDEETTKAVALSVPDVGEDETEVTLAGGESTNATLAVGTEDGDDGEYTATVATEDDEDSANVTVWAEGTFAVELVEATEPVEGENLTVTAAVENVGDEEHIQTVALSVPDVGEDETEVTLAGGESTNATLAVETGDGDAGEYTATVATEDDEDSANVTVLAPAEFAVESVEATEPVEGDALAVTVGVTNTGDVEGTGTLSVDVTDLGTDETERTLDAGESADVTLTVATEIGDAGEYEATVATEDDAVASTVEVFLPTLPGQENPPQDLSGDGLYEDVDGDGELDIFDVQTFFGSFDTDAVQNHAWAYDFTGDGDVSIFDVQELFNSL